MISLSEIKKINEKIKLIEQDLEEAASKNDVKYALGDIDKYEKELIKYKSFTINQKEINNKNRDEIAVLKKSQIILNKIFLPQIIYQKIILFLFYQKIGIILRINLLIKKHLKKK